MNTKIALSGLSIFAALALIGGATFAFFSDVETSTGNTFTAGAIDLKVDNTSYLNKVLQAGTTWTMDDLNGRNHLFFNFADVKPGDLGEDTISLHVKDNDAWACMNIRKTLDDDVSSTTPELAADDNPEDLNNPFDGELGSNLNFIFWADDGDNVLEQGEAPIKQGVASQLFDGASWTLADSGNNVFTGSGPLVTRDPTGDKTYYIGKAWCFGTLIPNPAQPGNGDPTVDPGVRCDGTLVNNLAQTDKFMADVTFSAVQSRNNSGFLCSPRPL